MNAIRPDLEELPVRLRALPVSDGGYPVPWFVAWVDGKPEFRAADASKFRDAIRFRKCWVCGEQLGRLMTFVIGPMCGINRTSAEPPCHTECARWSARNCPFLANAGRTRREDDAIDAVKLQECMPGHAIARNPGVTLLWTTRDYRLFSDGRGGALLKIGDPISIECWREGRIATREEVDESIRTGIPILEKIAAEEGPLASAELSRMRHRLCGLLPA